MFAGMKEEFYSCLEERFRDEENYKTLKSLLDDLSQVGLDDEKLQVYYSSRFGSKFEKDTGLVEFLMSMLKLGSSFMNRFDFDFGFDEFARALIFSSVEPFIKERVSVSDNLKEVCSEELITYYLQKNGVELSEEEYFYILGFTTHSDLHKYVSSLKSIATLEYKEKEYEREIHEAKNGDDFEEDDDSKGNDEDDLEALDNIDIDDIEKDESESEEDGEDGIEEVSEKSDSSDEEDDFSELDSMFEDDDEDEDGGLDIDIDEEPEENGEKKEEAEKSFEELFGE